jgi:hypothetical protein
LSRDRPSGLRDRPAEFPPIRGLDRDGASCNGSQRVNTRWTVNWLHTSPWNRLGGASIINPGAAMPEETVLVLAIRRFHLEPWSPNAVPEAAFDAQMDVGHEKYGSTPKQPKQKYQKQVHPVGHVAYRRHPSLLHPQHRRESSWLLSPSPAFSNQ